MIPIDRYGRFVTAAFAPADPMQIPGFNGYGPAPRGYGVAPRRWPPPDPTYAHTAAPSYPRPAPRGGYRGPIPARPHPAWRPPHYDEYNYDPRDIHGAPPPFDPQDDPNPDTAHFMRRYPTYMGNPHAPPRAAGYGHPYAGGYGHAEGYGPPQPYRGPHVAGGYDPGGYDPGGYAPDYTHTGYAHPGYAAPPPPPPAHYPSLTLGAVIDPFTGAIGVSGGAHAQGAMRTDDWTESEVAPGVILRVRRGVPVAWKDVGTPGRPVLYLTVGDAPDQRLASIIDEQTRAGFVPFLLTASTAAANLARSPAAKDAGRWIQDRASDAVEWARGGGPRALPAPPPAPTYADVHPRDYDYAAGAFDHVDALLVDSDGYRTRV